MKIVKFILFGILLSGMVFGQQRASQKEWKIFQQGVQDYKTGEYENARKNFSLVIKRLGPKSRLLTANYLMLAKTLYKMGRFQESLDICKQFLNNFPQSSYRDDIQFLMAENYYRMQRVQTAVQLWLGLAEKAQDQRLRKKALKLVKDALRYTLDDQDVKFLASQAKSQFQKKLIKYTIAERFYEGRNPQAALAVLEEYRSLPGQAPEIDRLANNLYDFLKSKETNTLRIAALLPLSGPNQEVGNAVLKGAQLALTEFNHINRMNIQLIPYDYKSKLETALSLMKEISRDPSIACVFGPLENDITAGCSIIADYEGITLITPTASGKDLRRLSHNVVQLAVPVDVLAIKLARFVVDSLDMRRVVTLSPLDDYFLDFTNTFTNYLKENFIEVPMQRWYYPEEGNLTEHFRILKRLGLKLTFQDSIMAADTTVQLSQIDSLYAEYKKAKIEAWMNSNKRVKIDSADIPVHSIDGILLPIYREDIAKIASQYAYWNIQAQILGNGDWYDIEALNRNKNYINGLLFISDRFINTESWDYRQFINKYRQMFQTTPGEYALLGYDNFNFVLQVIASNAERPTRSHFLEMIKSAPRYEGILRRFNIGEKRYNNAARVLKYVYGQIIPLN